ncbi:MAG: 50S ribosome-binding GTPase, partial [Chloroflexi bacterium]|nr:50S ribosome-binding GTPase [Chloroflexota bacterium]
MDPVSCLAALDGAISAATRMGLSTDQAREARARIDGRAGFPGDVYVLALVGGTGVGKSTLLNALAGEAVSQAGALRPTTDLPVAWIPSARAVQAGPLIDWLGGARSRVHSGARMSDVVILDLPDLDSVAADHRARVDAVLPRIDAVVWVSDPEKYQDAVLHDAYLRRWIPLLPRQVIVINKADRVSASDAQRLRSDLSRQLATEGGREVSVLMTAAAPAGGGVAGHGPDSEVNELRSWITDGAEAKRIVTARLAAEARAAVFALASEMGVPLDGSEPAAVVPEASRARATRETIERTLRVVDLAGLARQAEEATRAAARPRGGGPLGLLRTIAERGTGRHERRADPAGYLRRWRDRGSLVSAGEPLRDLMTMAVAGLPAQSRPLAAS